MFWTCKVLFSQLRYQILRRLARQTFDMFLFMRHMAQTVSTHVTLDLKWASRSNQSTCSLNIGSATGERLTSPLDSRQSISYIVLLVFKEEGSPTPPNIGGRMKLGVSLFVLGRGCVSFAGARVISWGAGNLIGWCQLSILLPALARWFVYCCLHISRFGSSSNIFDYKTFLRNFHSNKEEIDFKNKGILHQILVNLGPTSGHKFLIFIAPFTF